MGEELYLRAVESNPFDSLALTVYAEFLETEKLDLEVAAWLELRARMTVSYRERSNTISVLLKETPATLRFFATTRTFLHTG